MSKQKPISELNLHFIALMNMIKDFKKNNTSEYFEVVDKVDIPFKKIKLIVLKINQILTLMIENEYYSDYDLNVDWMNCVFKEAYAYLEELYNWK